MVTILLGVTAQLKQIVKDFWDEASCGQVYAEGGSPEQQFSAHSEARYSLEPYICPFARFDGQNKDVLEIGVGMGADHLEWAKSLPHRLVGIDLTPRAVDWTTRRLALYGHRSELSVGDAEDLAFPDESFDIVYSWGVLHHSPDTAKAFQEAWRVLRPGGELRSMIYHRPSIVGLLLWARYALATGKPRTSFTNIYANHLESPGTRGFTVAEGRALVDNFKSSTVQSIVSFGDTLDGEVGQQHSGVALSIAKRIWPRWIIRRLPALGLYLLVEATK
jgi:SAM-dependent methyltransferase